MTVEKVEVPKGGWATGHLEEEKREKKRALWELVHKNTGRFLMAFGWLNCFTGAIMAAKYVDESYKILYLVFGWVILCWIGLWAFKENSRRQGVQNVMVLQHEADGLKLDEQADANVNGEL